MPLFPACPAVEYAKLVRNGTIPAGPYIKGAVQRFMDDLRRARSPRFEFRFCPETAARATGFFENHLVLSGGEQDGAPFLLFLWQNFCLSNIYGWLHKETGKRRFRKVYIETGKGSGKSPMVAGMGLLAITVDGEARAQGYVIARTADQAAVTFAPAVAMVEDSPDLAARLVIRGGSNPMNIADVQSGSFLRKVATDVGGRQSGPIPHIVIVDEYHEHVSSAMRDMYAAGVKNRSQPLIIMITNSGVSLQSACGQEHIYARAVAMQEIEDDEYFAMVFGVEEKDDPMNDESCWIKANPSLCPDPDDKQSLSIPGYPYIRSQVREARGMPSKRSVVERLNFCRWVDAEAPWMDREKWESCEREDHDSTDEERRNVPTFVALDLSQKTDLTAGTVVFDFGDYLEAETHVWSPKDTIRQRAERDAVPYELWAEQGFITLAPGAIVDMRFIATWLSNIHDRWHIDGLAYDPWRIDLLQRELDALGVLTDRKPGNGIYLIPHPQGFVAGSKPKEHEYEEDLEGLRLWMPQSIDYAEEAILTGKVRVKINPALRMAIAGMVVVADAANNRRPTKTKSLLRIDPGVSFVMAVGAALKARRHPDAWRGTVDMDRIARVLGVSA